MDTLNPINLFPTTIYLIKKPEFLESVKKVSDDHLSKSSGEMTVMTGNYSLDESIKDFSVFVSQTAWNILYSQGYAVESLVTFFTEMWTQEHNKFSSMDYHVHGNGAQISAFYFLDVPKEGCRLVFHDPRPGKVIVALPSKDDTQILPSSQHVLMNVEEGMLVFTNAWLPHSFTRNLSDSPTRFVHMNLSVTIKPDLTPEAVEVV